MNSFLRRFVELCVIDKYLYCLENNVDWSIKCTTGAECTLCSIVREPTIELSPPWSRYVLELYGQQLICDNCMDVVRSEFHKQQQYTRYRFQYILAISSMLTISDIGRYITLMLPRIPSINLTSNLQ